MPRKRKYVLALIAAIFVAVGFTSCSDPYPPFRLRPSADKAHKEIKFSGTADRLENDGWKLSLIFDTLSKSDVQNVDIINEQYPLSPGEEGGKFVVAWEITRERWKDKKPFIVSLGLNDGNNKNVLITVKHSTYEIEPSGLDMLADLIRLIIDIWLF
jgi:hypothetical protein